MYVLIFLPLYRSCGWLICFVYCFRFFFHMHLIHPLNIYHDQLLQSPYKWKDLSSTKNREKMEGNETSIFLAQPSVLSTMVPTSISTLTTTIKHWYKTNICVCADDAFFYLSIREVWVKVCCGCFLFTSILFGLGKNWGLHPLIEIDW